MIDLKLVTHYDIDLNQDNIRFEASFDERFIRGMIANWDNILKGTGMTSEELFAHLQHELQYTVDRAVEDVKSQVEGLVQRAQRIEDSPRDASGLGFQESLFPRGIQAHEGVEGRDV